MNPVLFSIAILPPERDQDIQQDPGNSKEQIYTPKRAAQPRGGCKTKPIVQHGKQEQGTAKKKQAHSYTPEKIGDHFHLSISPLLMPLLIFTIPERRWL